MTWFCNSLKSITGILNKHKDLLLGKKLITVGWLSWRVKLHWLLHYLPVEATGAEQVQE